jgi:hypothetical protein
MLKISNDVREPVLQFGDTVYCINHPLDKDVVVVGMNRFDTKVHEYMVLGQFHDQVVVTSKDFVEKAFEERSEYWNAKNDEGYFCNFEPYRLGEACVRVIWRNHLFQTHEEVISFQKECIATAKDSLDNYAERLCVYWKEIKNENKSL